MNNLKKLSIVLAIAFSFQNCENEERNVEVNEPQGVTSPTNLEGESANYTVSQFGQNSYWASWIVDVNTTNRLKSYHNSSANLFALGNVPIYFAAGSGTYNALSYGPPNNYIVWGQELLQAAKNYGNAAIAYVAAHEMGHQVQFRNYGIPSSNNVSAVELEADGFSGYALYKTYSTNWNSVSSAYSFAQAIAGASGSSHGSAPQRRSAFRLGWWMAQTYGTFTPAQLDQYFFYYYNQYVLGGLLKQEVAKPKGITPELDNFILSKIDELTKINNGEISEEEFSNLESK
ncbi:hypothetical protein [Polaribacter sp. L3A8]|uniref:hypothetical protein n=1 Tax=Polaribacter sp. L3A8 TaxID=2686361 RepID=UPI00131AE27C|nr:hypothetical protein [Polaribacter sp. L3A8]